MRAIILVGGFGTRLRPLTLTTPKQMLPVVDRPMIERAVESLAAHGIDDAILSLGYRPDAFFEAYPDDRCAGVHLHYAVEPEPLDTAGAIGFAAAEAGIENTFLVVNGDVLSDLDLGALVDLHRSGGAEGTLALTQVEDPSRFGVVTIDERHRVEGFVEKPPPGEAPTDWINAGVYVFEPAVLDRIAPGRKVSLEREVFPAMVDDASLYARPDGAYWVDAGTPATYLQAQLDLIDGHRGAPEPARAGSADVDPAATVDHSVIMADAAVAAGATVRDSAVLPGAVIGAGASVVGSIVGPGARVGEGARLDGLCVLGDGAVVEPGEVLEAERRPAPE